MSSSVSSAVAKATAAAANATKVTPQGGILEGANPSKFDPKNPITLFIIQAGLIIVFCRLLHFPLSLMRQPRVIAEVIGGILLGPSVMGRIPGFTNAIFPAASLPPLNMAANLGLILFLFLVGLEVDLRLFRQNWTVALSVSAAGMILPFALGCGIAYGLYNEFHGEPGTVTIKFGVYMLFVGVAMAITAFPVLCRILTELKLLGTRVGVIVLSAGVGNDVTGWVLLALCVALVNAGSGLTALYVLLTCVAYVFFLVFAVRPAFLWVLRRTGSIQNGPTQSVVALTVLMVLASAFFTGIIGVHPIFGGFLIGLICPHDGGFAIKLTEKIEDLVSVLLLPLYFALSGLSTNIGLLDTGITWAYVFGVIAVAFCGKVIGGTLAARSCKLVWRESFTIGVLMSCKGLVELIVLNIGLQAKILSTRTFTIFVVMALVTTFATTPLVTALYPPWYQKKLEAWRRGEIDWDGNRLLDHDGGSDKDTLASGKLESTQIRKILVYLRLDALSSTFTFMTLLGDHSTSSTSPIHKTHPLKSGGGKITPIPEDDSSTARTAANLKPTTRPLEVHGLRMVELTERTSSVMQGSELDSPFDPIINVFRTFGSLHNVAVSGGLSVVPEGSFADALTSRAADLSSDLLLIPWSETGSITEDRTPSSLFLPDSLSPSSPSSTSATENRFASGPHNQFILDALTHASTNTAIFVNRGFGGPSTRSAPNPYHEPRSPGGAGLNRIMSGLSIRSQQDLAPPTAPIADRSHHIFFPFFGGPDDRVALRFVLQLAGNSNVTATILHIQPSSSSSAAGAAGAVAGPISTASSLPGTSSLSPVGAAEPSTPKTPMTPTVPQHVEDTSADSAFLSSLRDSLPTALAPRVLFATLSGSAAPLSDAVSRAKAEVGLSSKNAGDLVVVGRRAGTRRGVREELGAMVAGLGGGQETRRALGDVGGGMVAGGVKASVLVIQAGGKGLHQ